jgi:hypothetical protein
MHDGMAAYYDPELKKVSLEDVYKRSSTDISGLKQNNNDSARGSRGSGSRSSLALNQQKKPTAAVLSEDRKRLAKSNVNQSLSNATRREQISLKNPSQSFRQAVSPRTESILRVQQKRNSEAFDAVELKNRTRRPNPLK